VSVPGADIPVLDVGDRTCKVKDDVMKICSQCASPHAERTEHCETCGTTLSAASLVENSPPTHTVDPNDVDLVGHVLDGKYLVDAELAASAKVMVYRASRVGVGDTVILKILRGRWGVLDPAAVERFRREVRGVASLEHPSVAVMYDSGFSADGLLYTVSEMVDGASLRAMLDDGALAPRDTLDVLRQVASALDAAHRVDLIHRNLKPDNVFVSRKGGRLSVKVLDFGLTTIRSVAQIAKGFGSAGRAGGDSAYLAPEQTLGDEPDARSDVYALGLIAYEMLCAADSPTPASSQESGAALSPAVSDVLRRAASAQRAERPPTAGAFVHLLESAMRAAPTAPTAPTPEVLVPPPSPPAPSSSHFRLATALVAAALVVMVCGVSVAALAFRYVGSDAKRAILAEVSRGNLARATGSSAYDLFQSFKDGSLSAGEKAEIAGAAAVALERRGDDILGRLKENSRESEDDWEESIRIYGWLNELSPSARYEARGHFAEGRLAFMRRDYGSAATHFQRAVELEPTWAVALNGLGRTKARLGDRAAAIECYKRASEAEPGWIYPWLNLAVASVGAKDYATAEVALRRGLDIYPGRATTRFALGRTLERAGRACEALAEYRIALERAGDGKERPVFDTATLERRVEKLAASAHCS
jgi:serine/threonine protein kinase